MLYLLLILLVAVVAAYLWRASRVPRAAAPESSAVDSAAPLIQDAQFTVYRPSTVAPERWYSIFAFAHRATAMDEHEEIPADPGAEIERQVEALTGADFSTFKSASEDASQAVPQAGELIFVPRAEGLEFNPPERRFRWVQPIHREEFQFRATAELDGGVARGSLSVYSGAVLIADINLSIPVGAEAAEEAAADSASSARPYRKIFASYSHRDTEVVEQFEHYSRTLGDEFLRDVVTLRAGEAWNERLLEMIEEADVFQLFWSWNSIDSAYVRQEYEHALSLGRPNFVRPTYWEEPLPARPESDLPPQDLRRLHFHRLQAELSRPSEVPTEQFPRPDFSAPESGATLDFPTSRFDDAAPRRASRPSRGRIGKPLSALAVALLMAVALPYLWQSVGEDVEAPFADSVEPVPAPAETPPDGDLMDPADLDAVEPGAQAAPPAKRRPPSRAERPARLETPPKASGPSKIQKEPDRLSVGVGASAPQPPDAEKSTSTTAEPVAAAPPEVPQVSADPVAPAASARRAAFPLAWIAAAVVLALVAALGWRRIRS